MGREGDDDTGLLQNAVFRPGKKIFVLKKLATTASPTVLANFFFGLFFQNSILQQARQLVKKPLLSRTRLSFGGGARGGGSPPRVGLNALNALHSKAFSEGSEDFPAAVRRESNGIFVGRSVGQLVQQDRQLLQLFLRVPALHRLPDAAVHVGLEHHEIGRASCRERV